MELKMRRDYLWDKENDRVAALPRPTKEDFLIDIDESEEIFCCDCDDLVDGDAIWVSKWGPMCIYCSANHQDFTYWKAEYDKEKKNLNPQR